MDIEKLRETLVGLAKDVDVQTVATIKAARLAGIHVTPSSALRRGDMVLLISPHDWDRVTENDPNDVGMHIKHPPKP